MHIQCTKCKHESKSVYDAPCNECVYNGEEKDMFESNKKTNADRIRAMDDEELAEFFSERDKIPNRYKCKEIEDWVKWLQSEAE